MKLSTLRHLAILNLLLLGACTNGPSSGSAANAYYVVAAKNASFYKYGPEQGGGPDQKLAHNTVLKLIQPSFGYCKVQLMDGQEGYVAKDDIHVASPTLVAAVTSPPAAATSKTTKSHLRQDDPRLIAPPEPLPVDLPEPTPIPETLSSPTPN